MRHAGKNYFEKFLSEMGISPEKARGVSITAIASLVASALDPRESSVILQYYGIDCDKKSLRAIGSELGLSEKGAVSLRRRGLRKLKCLKQRERLFALTRREKKSEEILNLLLGIS